jgi:hypothetical protein
MVYFYEENHKYFNEHQQELISVSGLFYPYKPDFEDDKENPLIRSFRDFNENLYQEAKKHFKWYQKEEILQYMIDKDPGLYQEKVIQRAESLKELWNLKGEVAAEYGTEKHSRKEDEAFENGYILNPIDQQKYRVIPRASGPGYDNSYIMDEVLKMKENVCVLEGLVADEKRLVCGQEDRIYLKYMGAGFFHGMNYDFKTDKVLSYKSMWIKNDVERMKKELNYFNTAKIHYYSLKASCYGVLLENTGRVKVTHNVIEHIPQDKPVSYVKLNYYKKYAEYIIQKNFEKNSI